MSAEARSLGDVYREMECPPVLFLIFNRPDLTRRVFNQIRVARPHQFFIAADGPRADHPDDAALCVAARAVVAQVDWDCEVHTLFRDENLGCKQAVSSAITWFFEHVEEGIILEDDCLPDPTYFRYCAELLDYYRDDERVMVISGNNFQKGNKRSAYSYYFSCYNHIWGWATWRRAWKHYDGSLRCWPALNDSSWLLDTLGSEAAAHYWSRIFDRAYAGEIDSWGYPWTFSCWARRGLSCLPQGNLVTNIGFGEAATHTTDAGSKGANVPVTPMPFPLCHPPCVHRHLEADHFTFESHFGGRQASLARRTLGRLRFGATRIIEGLRKYGATVK
jgi:hypothetical protein